MEENIVNKKIKESSEIKAENTLEIKVKIDDSNSIGNNSDKECNKSIFSSINLFKHNIKGLRSIVNNLLDLVQMQDSEFIIAHEKKLKKIIYKIIEEKKNEDKLNPDLYHEIVMVIKDIPPNRSKILRKSLFLSIFTFFDAAFGDFLESTYYMKPELFKLDNKEVNTEKVFKFESLDEFKKYLVFKDIENIKRESYINQIEKFEKIYNLPLKLFENWGKFVETTQRRNLITHCNGVISEQYIEICKTHNCLDSKYKIGDKLGIDIEYLTESINIIEEVFLKLVHTIWRKQFEDELKQADAELNDYILDLLNDKNWSQAENLAEFACKQRRFFDNEVKLIYTINHCIAKKHLSNQENVIEILENTDFSAVKKEFVLAKEVLLDNYEEVYKLMIEIGDKSEIFTLKTYLEFPLFNIIKQEKKFKETYNRVFKIETSREIIESLSETLLNESVDYEEKT